MLNSILWFLGKCHIIIVHFPIAFLVVAGVCQLFHALKKQDGISSQSKNCLFIGSFGAILASTLGWLNTQYVEFHGSALDTLFWHKWLGILTCCLSVLLLVFAILLPRLVKKYAKIRQYFHAFFIIMIISLFAGSHFGGVLVHGAGYFLEPFQSKTLKVDDQKISSKSNSISKQKDAVQNVSFSQDIEPILKKYCTRCHGEGNNKGKYSIDSRESFIRGAKTKNNVIPFDSENSYLIKLISGELKDKVMPKKGKLLKKEEVHLIRKWIDEGLVWKDSKESKKKIDQTTNNRDGAAKLSLDKPKEYKKKESLLDEYLSTYFEDKKIVEPKLSSDLIFIKRAYLDLIGQLPSYQEVQDFNSNNSNDKYENLINKLLADNKKYANKWLSFWNDHLRNDYKGTGFVKGGREQITDWLYKSLKINKKYDYFVRELISPKKESKGFIRGLVWPGKVNPNERTEMQAAQNISQIFLGANIKCASCHDSFTDYWALKDAYGLANVFAESPLETHRCETPTGLISKASFLYPELGSIDANKPKKERIKELSKLVTHKDNGRFIRTIVNRIWGELLGRGLIADVDNLDKKAWSSKILDYLAYDFKEHNYDIKHLIKRILTSRAYRYKSKSYKNIESDDFIFRGPSVRYLSPESFIDSLEKVLKQWTIFSSLDATRSTRLLSVKKRAAVYSKQVYPKDKVKLSINFKGSKRFSFVVTRREKTYLDPAIVKISNIKFFDSQNNIIKHKFDQSTKSFRQLLHPDATVLKQDKLPDLRNSGELNLVPFSIVDIPLPAKAVKLDANLSVSEIKLPFTESYTPQKKLEKIATGRKNLIRFMILQDLEVPMSMRENNTFFHSLGRPKRDQVVTRRINNFSSVKALTLQTSPILNRLISDSAKDISKKYNSNSMKITKFLYQSFLLRVPETSEVAYTANDEMSLDQIEDLIWAIVNLPELTLIY